MSLKNFLVVAVSCTAILAFSVAFLGWRHRVPEGMHSFKIIAASANAEPEIPRKPRHYVLTLQQTDSDHARELQWSGYCTDKIGQWDLHVDFRQPQFTGWNDQGSFACFGGLDLPIWSHVWPTREKVGVISPELQKRKAELYMRLNEHLQAAIKSDSSLRTVFDDCTLSNGMNCSGAIVYAGDPKPLAKNVYFDSRISAEMASLGYDALIFENDKNEMVYGMRPTQNGWVQEQSFNVPPFAEFYYRAAVALQEKGDLSGAKSAFENVIATSHDGKLVENTKRRLADISAVMAKQEREQQAMGEPIGFASLYAKAYGSGLQIGKRYQVNAALNSDATMLYAFQVGSGDFIAGDHDFDDDNQLESVIRMAVNQRSGISCTVVVSMGSYRRILIHRAENCR